MQNCKGDNPHDCNTIVIVNLIAIGDISKPLARLLKRVWSSVRRKT